MATPRLVARRAYIVRRLRRIEEARRALVTACRAGVLPAVLAELGADRRASIDNLGKFALSLAVLIIAVAIGFGVADKIVAALNVTDSTTLSIINTVKDAAKLLGPLVFAIIAGVIFKVFKTD